MLDRPLLCSRSGMIARCLPLGSISLEFVRPEMMKMPSVLGFRDYAVTGTLGGGEAPRDAIKVIDLSSPEAFERENSGSYGQRIAADWRGSAKKRRSPVLHEPGRLLGTARKPHWAAQLMLLLMRPALRAPGPPPGPMRAAAMTVAMLPIVGLCAVVQRNDRPDRTTPLVEGRAEVQSE